LTISDEDELHHVMIGEAAMNLIFSREEVSTGSLINQLQSMARLEEDDDRLLKIWAARKWLLQHKQGSTDAYKKPHWLTAGTEHADPGNREADIRLHRVPDSENMEP